MTLPSAALVAMVLCVDEAPHTADALFAKFKDQIVQIRILERSSGTKAALGSGFYATAAGHIITNYHVVSAMVERPERYTAELVSGSGAVAPLKILDVDVVHDIAIVQAPPGPAVSYLTLADQLPAQGTQLFSFGNPHDLGKAIVEGVFNGLILDSLYDRLHFTGAINSGMSGGPTVTADGSVVGVNVASGGNGLGFLVPAHFARTLLETVEHHPGEGPLLDRVARQVTENQQRISAQLLGSALPTTDLDGHRVPGRWANWLKCWANPQKNEHKPYQVTHYFCSSDETLYISDSQETGIVRFWHVSVGSSELNAWRFSALYGHIFGDPPDWPELKAGEEDVTNFRCDERDALTGSTTLRVAFCIRAYRKMHGLYDVVVRAGTIEASEAGVQTTVLFAGFTYENAVALSRKYLEAVSWTE